MPFHMYMYVCQPNWLRQSKCLYVQHSTIIFLYSHTDLGTPCIPIHGHSRVNTSLHLSNVVAGDVVAAALPNIKCLRKVKVEWMNSVPVLQSVGSCVKLQEVTVWHPTHCEVGMRCAYEWMYVDCVFT